MRAKRVVRQERARTLLVLSLQRAVQELLICDDSFFAGTACQDVYFFSKLLHFLSSRSQDNVVTAGRLHVEKCRRQFFGLFQLYILLSSLLYWLLLILSIALVRFR